MHEAPQYSEVPAFAQAVIFALRLSTPNRAHLSQLNRKDWQRAIGFCRRTQLILPLRLTCVENVPEWLRPHLDRDLANNAERWRRLKANYQEVACAFTAEGLEFAVLKGFSQCPLFVSDPRHRSIGDLDLLFQRHQILRARDIAQQLGYESIVPYDGHPMDHLPTMVRKTGWEWRGDDYDIEMPVSLELHFRCWDSSTERFEPKGLEQFWERRQKRELEELEFVAFHPADAIAYSALHLLRHLLRGDLRPFHLYELACLLHHNAENVSLWSIWSELHDESLRRLEVICFSLAERWFACELPTIASKEIETLPVEIARWLSKFSMSPMTGLFYPNKDELLLHWYLANSSRDRYSILLRRLLPLRWPGPVDAVHVPQSQRTMKVRYRSLRRYLIFAASRAKFHIVALLATLGSTLQWISVGTGLGPQYWRFFFAEGFFDFGMFVFVFLYNFYLLQLGFRENFVGMVSGIMTVGSVGGSLLAGFAVQRIGIRRTLVFSFALTTFLSVLRACTSFGASLVGLAAAAGVASSAWPVVLPPAIAELTNKESRLFAFSLTSAAGILVGVVGGVAAGNLPSWLLKMHVAATPIEAYRESLIVGCTMVVLSLWRLWGVRFTNPVVTERKIVRPSPFLVRFLFVMAVWSLGTGALNPFFNVFFIRRTGMAVNEIGAVFACAQLAQGIAILLAPLVFKRVGLGRGISGMQCATALMLVGLALTQDPTLAALGYTAYMAAQYMSEPGIFTLLMGKVTKRERGTASALNFVVTCGGQAVGTVAAGALLVHFGYPPVMSAAAVFCLAAALLSYALLGRPSRMPLEPGKY
jgi:MFS family permease